MTPSRDSTLTDHGNHAQPNGQEQGGEHKLGHPGEGRHHLQGEQYRRDQKQMGGYDHPIRVVLHVSSHTAREISNSTVPYSQYSSVHGRIVTRIDGRRQTDQHSEQSPAEPVDGAHTAL